jgi:hypothetical protein
MLQMILSYQSVALGVDSFGEVHVRVRDELVSRMADTPITAATRRLSTWENESNTEYRGAMGI